MKLTAVIAANNEHINVFIKRALFCSKQTETVKNGGWQIAFWKERKKVPSLKRPHHTPSPITDLPQHDDAVLRAPVGGDVKHAGAVAPDDPVVHLCVLSDVGVHGADQSHRPSELNGLGHPELEEGCEERIFIIVIGWLHETLKQSNAVRQYFNSWT